MTVGVAEEEPLADFEDTPDELAVADVEAETVAELVAAPVATLEALAEAETVTLELVVAVALLVALELVVAVHVALLVALALGDSELAVLLVAELNAVELITEVAELAPVAEPSAVLVAEPETDRDELAVADVAERGDADGVGVGVDVGVRQDRGADLRFMRTRPLFPPPFPMLVLSHVLGNAEAAYPRDPPLAGEQIKLPRLATQDVPPAPPMLLSLTHLFKSPRQPIVSGQGPPAHHPPPPPPQPSYV